MRRFEYRAMHKVPLEPCTASDTALTDAALTGSAAHDYGHEGHNKGRYEHEPPSAEKCNIHLH